MLIRDWLNFMGNVNQRIKLLGKMWIKLKRENVNSRAKFCGGGYFEGNVNLRFKLCGRNVN